MPAASLESWIDGLQTQGRYSFQRAEAVRDSGLSAQAAGKALQRAVKSGRLTRPKEYFYVIVPLEYRAAGAPPVSWFIHDLMKAMQLPYDVSLLSAAALHGASHQQPQTFQVMTDRSVRSVLAGHTRIRFFASQYMDRAAAMPMKTPTGSMQVSSPETTVVDRVRFVNAAGHLDHVASVIAELAPSLRARRLVTALAVVHDIPNTQRLGYILDELGERKLSDSVHRWVQSRIERFQPLRLGQSMDDAPENHRWDLLINGPVEIES
jgi:predicted transcriptional regulator of viral defense system